MPHADPEKRYPRWGYHPTLAKEGFLIKTEADEPQGDGWVDTPAAFAADYVAPPDATANMGGMAASLRVSNAPIELYPSWRYPVAGGEPVEVKTAEDDAKLDPKVWKVSPDPKHWEGEKEEMARPDVSDGAAKPSMTASIEQFKADQAQRESLWATTVDDVVERIKTQTDRATLEKVRAFEAVNPDGPRVGILKAVKAALDKLPTE